jgi:hypothetical protein
VTEVRVLFTGPDFDALEPPVALDVTASFATDHGMLTDYRLAAGDGARTSPVSSLGAVPSAAR